MRNRCRRGGFAVPFARSAQVRTAGRDGVAIVSEITGLARSTINRGPTSRQHSINLRSERSPFGSASGRPSSALKEDLGDVVAPFLIGRLFYDRGNRMTPNPTRMACDSGKFSTRIPAHFSAFPESAGEN